MSNIVYVINSELLGGATYVVKTLDLQPHLRR